MRKVIEGKVARYAFDSLAELSRYIADTPRTWSVSDSEHGRAREAWDLALGYEGALRYARDGWLEGAQVMQEALEKLPMKSNAPETVNDFYGHMAHVPRYCAGAPDSMIRYARDATNGSGRVLTLYVPVNAMAHVSADCMRNFGLGVAQYVNQLETQGMRVELHGMIASLLHSDTWRVSHTWQIKSADQPLDLAVAAFSIGHPAMFRRLGFALRERCAAPTYATYGRTADATLSDVIDAPIGSYILNGMKYADKIASTPDDALEYVRSQIQRMLDTPDASGGYEQ